METEILLNITLLSLLIITALTAVVARNLLTSVITLAIFSLLMAAIYLVLDAPDVATTEAAVGAGVTTILFLTTLAITGSREKLHINKYAFVAVLITGSILFYSTIDMPDFGDQAAPANNHVAPYYITNTKEDTGINNIVSAILASYRGFDTLGEVVVIFTAGISILMLLGTEKKKKS